jgi:DNA-binding NtrC family response regulator
LNWHKFCMSIGILFTGPFSMGSKLIFVGSEIYLSDEIKSILDEGGYEIESCESIEEATQKLDRTWSSVLLIDLDGKEITNRQIRDFRRSHKEVQIVAFSSRTYHPELKESLREDVCACLAKPLNPDELVYWLNSITEVNPDPMITELRESSFNV